MTALISFVYAPATSEPSGCQDDAYANRRGEKRNETEQHGKSLEH